MTFGNCMPMARNRCSEVLLRTLGVAVLLCNATVLHGQPRLIRDPVMCPACTIDASLLVRLGPEDGPGALPGQPLSVFADSQDRYWVINSLVPPFVFASDGRFLAEVGRRGQGPGEVLRPVLGVPVGDSVFVFDASGRLNVVGPDLQPLRTVRVSGFTAYDALWLDWAGRLLLNGGRLQDPVGAALHVADAADDALNIARSFGSAVPISDPYAHLLSRRRLAASEDSVIWSSEIQQYRIEGWTSDGARLHELERVTSWFPLLDDLRRWNTGGPDRPPNPSIAAIRLDERRRLWVYAHVPASSWRDAWTEDMRQRPDPDRARTRSARISVDRPGDWELYDTVIEIIDPVQQSVVASGMIRGYVISVLGDGRAVTYVESDVGVPHIEIYAVRMISRQSR